MREYNWRVYDRAVNEAQRLEVTVQAVTYKYGFFAEQGQKLLLYLLEGLGTVAQRCLSQTAPTCVIVDYLALWFNLWLQINLV